MCSLGCSCGCFVLLVRLSVCLSSLFDVLCVCLFVCLMCVLSVCLFCLFAV